MLIENNTAQGKIVRTNRRKNIFWDTKQLRGGDSLWCGCIIQNIKNQLHKHECDIIFNVYQHHCLVYIYFVDNCLTMGHSGTEKRLEL